MSNDGEIWSAYAKGVRRIGKTASSRRKPGSSGTIGKNQLKNLQNVSIGKSAWIPAFAGMTPKQTIMASLTRRIERSLRQGDIDIDARIDLHGMTQQKAYEALERFIAAHAKAGRRNLLVITGKGRNNQGVIRASLPGWLENLPEAAQILALRSAAPKHGGDGAFYVLLKKKK